MRWIWSFGDCGRCVYARVQTGGNVVFCICFKLPRSPHAARAVAVIPSAIRALSAHIQFIDLSRLTSFITAGRDTCREASRLINSCQNVRRKLLGKPTRRAAPQNGRSAAEMRQFVRQTTLCAQQHGHQYLRKLKRSVEAMTAASHSVTGPTKNAKMYHIEVACQLARKKLIVSTRATKCHSI